MGESIGALCARDYKGCSVQWAGENKFVILKKDSSRCLRTIAPCLCGTSRALTGGGSEVFVLADNDIKSLPDYIVRRLTPMECERLQAYPDGWCDIPPFEVTDKRGKKKLKKVTDSDKYKALGNSIATCAWTDIMQSMAERCGEKTLGSLFDGIGGFPLIWERDCGGKAVWASEIEPYCVAVTEYRFPENGDSKLCSQNRNVERESHGLPRRNGYNRERTLQDGREHAGQCDSGDYP